MTKDCEYAIVRKDILMKDVYAKCKLTKDDCWIFYNKNGCGVYQNNNKSKCFYLHKGNHICLQDIIEKLEKG